jgi:hypothetical protein
MAKKVATSKIIGDLDIVDPKSKKKAETVEDTTPAADLSDSERMIELLEAIDWKLWMLFKKFGVDEE